MATPQNYLLLTTHDLGSDCLFQQGRVPDLHDWGEEEFERGWALRPPEKPVITVQGWTGPAPRWMRAFERDYQFSRQTSHADPAPLLLLMLLKWAKNSIDTQLNGILVNFYEPRDYIGQHHDVVKGLIKGAPIVTISFGETRKFRLTREGKRNGKTIIEETRDFSATNGSLFVMPFLTNDRWKHGVPRSTRYAGRRISVTLRAFEEEASNQRAISA